MVIQEIASIFTLLNLKWDVIIKTLGFCKLQPRWKWKVGNLVVVVSVLQCTFLTKYLFRGENE